MKTERDIKQTRTNPVYGLEVNVDNTALLTQYQGANYYFCNDACRMVFKKTRKRMLIKTGSEKGLLNAIP